jgi:hypothetical protein
MFCLSVTRQHQRCYISHSSLLLQVFDTVVNISSTLLTPISNILLLSLPATTVATLWSTAVENNCGVQLGAKVAGQSLQVLLLQNHNDGSKTAEHDNHYTNHGHVMVCILSQRETEEKARQPETKLGAIAQTRHIARLRNAKRSRTKHPKPTHGARNNLSRGPMESAYRSPASGTRCDVRARPTQGRVAPAKGNAKLPERTREEGGPRHARPGSLHSLVGQVPEQRQGRSLKAPEGLDRLRQEGQGRGHLPIRMPLGGVPGSGRKPGGTRSAHSKGGSRRVDDGNGTHHKPAREYEHDFPRAPGPRGGGT